MQTVTILFLGVILVQNFSPLCGKENTKAQDGSNTSIKWMSDVITNGLMRAFKPIEHINVYLYTKTNPKVAHELFPDNSESLETSPFNRSNPTRVLIHGWLSNSDQAVNTLIRDAYLSTGPHNIIVINWSRKSRALYPTAVLGVPDVGKKVAAFIDFMDQHDFVKPENITLVGHSMGAHVAGIAGRNLKSGQLHTIIGLDPALPLFPYNSTDGRLCSTDAYYVESIQTNGALLGYVKPIGKATFYPNGGLAQLGCDLDPGGTCSHARSYKFFAQAIRINGFPSIECSDYKQAAINDCGNKFSETVRMGAPSNADCASGAYYVPTLPMPPYAVKPE